MNKLAKQLLAEEAPVISPNSGERWRSHDVTNAIIGTALGNLGSASSYQHGSPEHIAFHKGIDAAMREIRPALEAVPAQSLAVAYNTINGKDPQSGAVTNPDQDHGFNLNLPDGDI